MCGNEETCQCLFAFSVEFKLEWGEDLIEIQIQ